MKHLHLPASLTHAAHTLHKYVGMAEHGCHYCYLGMVATGATTYWIAAGAMLATSLVGVALHWIIASEVAS
jgi:DNA repair photolyase